MKIHKIRSKGIALERYAESFSGLTKTQEKARFQHIQMLSPTSRSKEHRLRSILEGRRQGTNPWKEWRDCQDNWDAWLP